MTCISACHIIQSPSVFPSVPCVATGCLEKWSLGQVVLLKYDDLYSYLAVDLYSYLAIDLYSYLWHHIKLYNHLVSAGQPWLASCIRQYFRLFCFEVYKFQAESPFQSWSQTELSATYVCRQCIQTFAATLCGIFISSKVYREWKALTIMHTVKWHFSVRVLFMQSQIWSHQFAL